MYCLYKWCVYIVVGESLGMLRWVFRGLYGFGVVVKGDKRFRVGICGCYLFIFGVNGCVLGCMCGIF